MDIKKVRQKAFELFEKMSHFKDFYSFIKEKFGKELVEEKRKGIAF